MAERSRLVVLESTEMISKRRMFLNICETPVGREMTEYVMVGHCSMLATRMEQ